MESSAVLMSVHNAMRFCEFQANVIVGIVDLMPDFRHQRAKGGQARCLEKLLVVLPFASLGLDAIGDVLRECPKGIQVLPRRSIAAPSWCAGCASPYHWSAGSSRYIDSLLPAEHFTVLS